ncbi:hypothetical protein GCM10011369_27280 [Neiella marina]|uniref:STAS domain-containing protein n=1 Tax=Neiella marina TaxID=508461 RepID=A0A8J2XQ62_9GAMM|nr:STAS domain-containing protein [Neiella marina]GGA83800.1 hypothetical protein GCM10011369_27280 [Neiella marina]
MQTIELHNQMNHEIHIALVSSNNGIEAQVERLLTQLDLARVSKQVVLHMADVDELSVSVLAKMLQLAKYLSTNGGQLFVADVQSKCQRMMTLLRIDLLIPVIADQQQSTSMPQPLPVAA